MWILHDALVMLVLNFFVRSMQYRGAALLGDSSGLQTDTMGSRQTWRRHAPWILFGSFVSLVFWRLPHLETPQVLVFGLGPAMFNGGMFRSKIPRRFALWLLAASSVVIPALFLLGVRLLGPYLSLGQALLERLSILLLASLLWRIIPLPPNDSYRCLTLLFRGPRHWSQERWMFRYGGGIFVMVWLLMNPLWQDVLLRILAWW